MKITPGQTEVYSSFELALCQGSTLTYSEGTTSLDKAYDLQIRAGVTPSFFPFIDSGWWEISYVGLLWKPWPFLDGNKKIPFCCSRRKGLWV